LADKAEHTECMSVLRAAADKQVTVLQSLPLQQQQQQQQQRFSRLTSSELREQ
jgi:hypothetical protein